MYEYQMFRDNWEKVSAKIQQQALEGWRVIGFTTDGGAAGGFYVIMEREKRKADKRGSAAPSSAH